MVHRRKVAIQIKGYLVIAASACICAALFSWLNKAGSVPVLGAVPLLPTTLCAALIGAPLLLVLHGRAIGGLRDVQVSLRNTMALLGCGALLAVPPIAIDFATGFPRDINVPFPMSLLFYPAIALVAEVAFHLFPLAALTVLSSQSVTPPWVFAAVVFVEPVFQAITSSDAGVQSVLVFGNVSLISAAQIWLFTRYGIIGMIGLRLAFYLFWHVLWGALRLPVLF